MQEATCAPLDDFRFDIQEWQEVPGVRSWTTEPTLYLQLAAVQEWEDLESFACNDPEILRRYELERNS